MSTGHRTRFLGVPLDLLDMAATVARIERHLETARPGVHAGVNAANLVMARDRPDYLADLSAADLITADGQSVVWAARLLGMDVPERVTGIDLMEALLAASVARGWRVYLLGAEERVVSSLAGRLRERGIRVAGHRDGYFGPNQSASIVEAVRDSGAELLFVGLPSPQKERFMIHHARPGGIPFSIGVGGSFDVLSGQLRRAPRTMQRAGLEWVFRLWQEPARLLGRYARTNTRFAILFVAHAIRRRRRSA